MSLSSGVRVVVEHIADEVFETFSHDGSKVDDALDLHDAFLEEGGEPRGSLSLNLLRLAVRRGAEAQGAQFHPEGRSRLVYVTEGFRRYVFRLRAGDEVEGGGLRIETNGCDPFRNLELDALIVDEPWVLAYIRSMLGGIGALYVAKIIGVTDDKTPVLVLDHITRLRGGGSGLPPAGFRGDPDDLDDGDLGGLGGVPGNGFGSGGGSTGGRRDSGGASAAS